MGQSIVTNTDYDRNVIELFRDQIMPHPHDRSEVICLPQGMQLRWTHKVRSKNGCSGCGGAIYTIYYVNAIVGLCKEQDTKLPIFLEICGEWVIETTEQRIPVVCTLFDADRRGINIDTLTPIDQRKGYKW